MVDTSYYCRGQIWYRSNTREEEGRSVITKVRPVLIVSNNVGLAYSNIAIVVPLTSSPRLRTLPTQVPIDVKPDRGFALASSWIIAAAKNRGGKSFVEKLTNELIDASNGNGAACKKREDTHRMAEANKAFAHYRY